MPSRPNAMNALLRPLSHLVVASAVLVASVAHAQSAAPAPDAEKQKLIDRLLVLFHPENRILQMVQQQGLNAMQQSGIALQTAHVTPERKDKTLAEIHDDVQKYIDTTMPVAVASAKKLTGPAVSPLLQTFSVDELRQLLAFYESPVKAKFEKLVPQMESAVGQKVQADIAPTVDKNVKTMTEAVGTKLRVAATLQ
jgi:hypothetical protein